MDRDDIIKMAREAGLPYEYDTGRVLHLKELERFAALIAAAEREKVAAWMMERGYATGHGDTIEDLLHELEWQIREQEQAAKQEPVAWGVDWGKAGDIPCVSIGKRLPDGSLQVVALEYAPYSYNTPQPQEFVCSTGLCRFTLTQTGVGIGERGMQAYEEAKKRGWVGISDEQPSEQGVSNEQTNPRIC